MALTCPHCKTRVKLENQGPGISAPDGRTHALFTCVECQNVCWGSWTSKTDLRVDAPLLRTGASPDIPPLIASSFSEAIGALNAGLSRASVIMARSAIQAAVRELGAEGRTLAAEIRNLADSCAIPVSLADWANEIRGAGNPVAHPKETEQTTAQDAEEIVAFAESLFDYLYVIPAEVARCRARTKGSGAGTATEGPGRLRPNQSVDFRNHAHAGE